ncbi:MAG: tetratricopeptide repeat protein, partial [Planctomycetes bacterium]|nr:tetratricopeptide repeat protein [Planctomycetota bacterium]
PVFYPAYLFVVYLLTGSSIIAAKVLGVVLGAITCVLTCQLGRKVFNRSTGIVAGIIVALYGPLIFFEAELLATGWATFWAVALILLFVRADAVGGRGSHLGLGICGGLAVLTRPTFLPFLVATFVWLAVRQYRSRKGARFVMDRSVMVAVGFAVATIPAAYQNLRVTGHFGITPANGGVNLYMGNNPDSAKTEATRPWLDYLQLRDVAAKAGAEDQWSESAFFYRKTVDYVLTRPGSFLAGLLRKGLQFLCAREIPSYEDVYYFRQWSGLLRVLSWKIGGFGFPFGVLLIMASWGVVSGWRRIPAPVGLLLVLYPASVVLVHVTGRYRMPAVPVLAIFAAAGLLAVIEAVRSRRWPALAVMGGVTAAVALLSSVPGPFPMEGSDYGTIMQMGLGDYHRQRFGPTNEAATHYREALHRAPAFLEAHTGLAHVLLEQGRVDEALAHYEEAYRIDPDFAGVRQNLVRALVRIGRVEEAAARCQEWVERNPESAEAHRRYAAVLASAQRNGEAIVHFREAIRLGADDAETHHGLGLALHYEGRYAEAVAEYEAAVLLDQDHLGAHYNMAITLAALGRLDDAVRQYRVALRLDPRHFGAWYNLANTLLRRQDYAEAIAAYQAALEIDPRYPAAHYNMGLAMEESGRLEEAAAKYRDTLRLAPDHDLARQGLRRVTSPS